MKREELLNMAKPILFNTEMVKAILDGRKTVTRRIIKPRYRDDESGFQVLTNKSTGERWVEKIDENECGIFADGSTRYVNPPYKQCDILYVRETFANTWTPDGHEDFVYKADGQPPTFPYWGNVKQSKDEVWIPSIHMPKDAARIYLKVTDVKVERLKTISPDDIFKEGVDPFGKRLALPSDWITPLKKAYEKLWDSTVDKKDLELYGWNANPWVWVIELEKIEIEGK